MASVPLSTPPLCGYGASEAIPYSIRDIASSHTPYPLPCSGSALGETLLAMMLISYAFTFGNPATAFATSSAGYS